MSKPFQFKQFTIHQDQCAMKVSLDACLFGAICDVQTANHILDIGAGTGLLSLMLAQRSHAHIHAVEIDSDAASQAKVNIQKSPFKNQIALFNSNIQTYCKQTDQSYEVIISNPPFFSGQLKNPDDKRRIARHTETLSFKDLSTSISTLLSKGGKAWVLLPPDEHVKFSRIAKTNDLYLHKHFEVKSTTDKPSKLGIWVYSNEPCEIVEMDTFEIYEPDKQEYTQKFKGYLRDYYLKL